MLSPRVLAFLALGLAAVAALPTEKSLPKPITVITNDDIDDRSWFSFPMFGQLLTPLWKLFPTFNDFGPKIVSDGDQFKIIVNVKDYDKDDLKVKLKKSFIFVEGSHEAKHEDHDVFASQFFHTYTLPVNASADDVTAELTSDGYLIVIAPIKGSHAEGESKVDRDVPIKETGEPYKSEETTTVSADDSKVTPAAPEELDDKKEPTTPASEKEIVTEKDNSIPHGNEVIPL